MLKLKFTLRNILSINLFYFQIGAASRIPGIKPSSVLRLLYYIKSQKKNIAIN